MALLLSVDAGTTSVKAGIFTPDGQCLAVERFEYLLETPAPGLPEHRFPPQPSREDFNTAQLPIDFQWLRTPWPEEIFSLAARPGCRDGDREGQTAGGA